LDQLLGIRKSAAHINEKKKISREVKPSDITRMSRNKTGGATARHDKNDKNHCKSD